LRPTGLKIFGDSGNTDAAAEFMGSTSHQHDIDFSHLGRLFARVVRHYIYAHQLPLGGFIGANHKRRKWMAWTAPVLVEICIGLENNGYLPAEFWFRQAGLILPIPSVIWFTTGLPRGRTEGSMNDPPRPVFERSFSAL
jgi:hypothetical protein